MGSHNANKTASHKRLADESSSDNTSKNLPKERISTLVWTTNQKSLVFIASVLPTMDPALARLTSDGKDMVTA
jgi:hypothetical protein